MRLSGLDRVVFLLAALVTASDAAAQAAPAPAQPVFCAVEIGSRGVKGRLFSFADAGGKDRRQVDSMFSKDINTNIVASMSGSEFTNKGIEDAVAATVALMTEMRAARADCKAFVVGSSGIAGATNKELLAAAVVEAAKVPKVEFVTVEEEGRFGFMGSVPRRDWDVTTFTDVGSGNTKISTLAGKDFRTMEIPYGSVSLTKYAANAGGDFSREIDRIIDAELRPKFKMNASAAPSIVNRRKIVMVGGAAWGISTFAKPDSVRRRFVRMSSDEFVDFRRELDSMRWSERTPPLTATRETKQVFASESRKVLDTFTRDNLIAGHSLLRLLIDERPKDTPIYFARHGGWLFGYVQERYAADLWGQGGIEEHI